MQAASVGAAGQPVPTARRAPIVLDEDLDDEPSVDALLGAPGNQSPQPNQDWPEGGESPVPEGVFESPDHVLPQTAVRLIGLRQAGHLNGQIAIVLRFLHGKGRYEVGMHPGQEKKAVQLSNMQLLPVAEEVALIRERLVAPGVSSAVVRAALKRMEVIPVNAEVLQQTYIGKVVNDISKSFANASDISELAKRLVFRWRDLFRQTKAAELSGGDAEAQKRPQVPTTPAPTQGTVRPPQAKAPGNGAKPAAVGSSSMPSYTASSEAPATTTNRDAKRARVADQEMGQAPGYDADAPVSQQARTQVAQLVAAQQAAAQQAAAQQATAQAAQQAAVQQAAAQAAANQQAAAAQAQLAAAQQAAQAAVQLAAQQAAQQAALQAAQQAAAQQAAAQQAAAAVQAARQAATRPTANGVAPGAAQPQARTQAMVQNVDVGSDVEAMDDGSNETLPANCPPELAHMQPAYVNLLTKNPKTLQFLLKHPHVMKDMSAENIKFLIRRVKQSYSNPQHGRGDPMAQVGSGGRSVRIAGLPPEASESDVEALFHRAGFGPAEVSIARESRYRRCCGVAHAVLPSQTAAREAVVELRTATLNGHIVTVEWAGAAPGHSGGGRRIAWKDDDELWDVALFDRFESVLTFNEKFRNHSEALASAPPANAIAAAAPDEKAALFREAQARERAEEARRVREALTGS